MSKGIISLFLPLKDLSPSKFIGSLGGVQSEKFLNDDQILHWKCLVDGSWYDPNICFVTSPGDGLDPSLAWVGGSILF